MSLKSWKEEFYPVRAADATHPLQHSLQKWIGLRPENLERHEVFINSDSNVESENGDSLSIDSSSCALCTIYLDNGCADCPLIKAHEAPCDQIGWGGENPFAAWCSDHYPEPMIQIIQKAIGNEHAARNTHVRRT